MYNKSLEYLKSYSPDDVVSKNGVAIRRMFYPLYREILKLANPYKPHIVREAKLPKGVPKVFAATHGFKDDYLNTMIATREHAYTMFGSIDEFYYTFDGILAHLMGVCIIDRDDPQSRAAIIPKMERAMSHGTNALVFPEGAWNLTDNELVMKLYPGFYHLAKLTNAMVVPIGLHVDGQNCYVIKDEGFYVSEYTREEACVVLREKLATLKYELAEKYSSYTRAELEACGKPLSEQWEEYKRKLKSEPKYYIEEKEINYPYVDKDKIEFEEVSAHLKAIKITKGNAFLLR